MPTAAKPASDHNQMSPEQRQALFHHHVGLIIAQNKRVKDERDRLKQLRLDAKADGFELGGEIDFAVRVRTAVNTGAIVTSLGRTLRAATWLNLPLDFQPDLFEQSSKKDSEGAFQRGFEEGSQGITLRTPDGYVGDVAKAHADGWRKGQDEVAEAMRIRMERVNAEAEEKRKADEEKAKKAAEKRAKKAHAETPPPPTDEENKSGPDSKVTPFPGAKSGSDG